MSSETMQALQTRLTNQAKEIDALVSNNACTAANGDVGKKSLLEELAKSTGLSLTDRFAIAESLKEAKLISSAQHKICAEAIMQHPKTDRATVSTGQVDKAENKAEKRRKQLLSFADLYRTSATDPKPSKRLMDILESKTPQHQYEQKAVDQVKRIVARSPLNRFLIEKWTDGIDEPESESEAKEIIRLAKLDVLNSVAAEFFMQRLVAEENVPFDQARKSVSKIKSTIEDPSLLGIGDITSFFVTDTKKTKTFPAPPRKAEGDRKRPREGPAGGRGRGAGRPQQRHKKQLLDSEDDEST